MPDLPLSMGVRIRVSPLEWMPHDDTRDAQRREKKMIPPFHLGAVRSFRLGEARGVRQNPQRILDGIPHKESTRERTRPHGEMGTCHQSGKSTTAMVCGRSRPSMVDCSRAGLERKCDCMQRREEEHTQAVASWCPSPFQTRTAANSCAASSPSSCSGFC